jgi:hypothetical protein
MLIAAKPRWASPKISLDSLECAILLWILVDVIDFIFWEAFTYELMKGFPKIAIPLIVILWAGLYNAPLLTGKLDLFDLTFFGFLFTLVYHKTRNSAGILVAYLLNENPLWWVISAVFGSNIEIVFTSSLILRTLISFTSAFWVIREKILGRC